MENKVVLISSLYEDKRVAIPIEENEVTFERLMFSVQDK